LLDVVGAQRGAIGTNGERVAVQLGSTVRCEIRRCEREPGGLSGVEGRHVRRGRSRAGTDECEQSRPFTSLVPSQLPDERPTRHS
jgi:hypothetical protein